MDFNYIEYDSGEKHIFENVRVDGSTVQLHFHKNGSMDAPHPSPAPSQNTPSGAQPPAEWLQPLVFTAADIVQTVNEHGKIGRNEAHMACMSLLRNEDVGAIDITDEVGFQWKRFLRNQCMTRYMVGPGVCKVLVARFHRQEKPCFVLCRVDFRYCVIVPGNKLRHEFYEDWNTVPMLSDARMATRPWLQIDLDN